MLSSRGKKREPAYEQVAGTRYEFSAPPYLPDSSFTHAKLAASSVLPVPFHRATKG